MVLHPSVPILYGSVATKVANASKLHPEHTHTWDVYVKCPNDRDLGKIVKKVVFKLHDSFTHPNRTVEKAPYSVTESGWGEFEIQIKIHWVDPREKPVSFYHLLKLYPNDTTLAKENSIISEFYDEIVFPNASSAMYQAIEAFNTSGSDSFVNGARDYAEVEKSQLETMEAATAKLSGLIKGHKAKQSELVHQIKKLKSEYGESTKRK